MHRNTLAGWICCSALTLTNPVQSQSLFSEMTATAHLALNDPAWSSSFGDYDNDGRPDLLVTATEIADPAGQRMALWHSEGNGMFSDQTRSVDVDVTTKELGGGALFGDYDLDGFLDVYFGCCNNRLFHNNGNAHHWLRVELVGARSNRNGIGASLISTAGPLRQVRGIVGGSGQYQDELVAHLGLGAQARVDSLEIRWPSGQVDMLRDIPADQKIRVIEGSGNYTPVLPSTWAVAPPASVHPDETIDLVISVQPALFESGARIAQVRADLSRLGGPGVVVLQENKEGVYEQEVHFTVKSSSAAGDVAVLIEQETSVGTVWARLSRQVAMAQGTVVGEEHTTDLPQAFSLGQNFPNPFNSKTGIPFALPEGGEVRLAVYNLAGQQVARLAEGVREAGNYTAYWDGRGSDGRELASGVYLYRLRLGAQVTTRKLALLR